MSRSESFGSIRIIKHINYSRKRSGKPSDYYISVLGLVRFRFLLGNSVVRVLKE